MSINFRVSYQSTTFPDWEKNDKQALICNLQVGCFLANQAQNVVFGFYKTTQKIWTFTGEKMQYLGRKDCNTSVRVDCPDIYF